MDFENFSRKTISEIEKELVSLLKEWRSEVGEIDKKLLPFLDKFISGCWGGKRIRGNLVVLGYAMSAESGIKSEESKNKEIYKVAAVYEMLHSAILAHDDIIDQSVLRRGQPSLYTALGGNHYGVSQALSLGDAVFFLAVRIISDSNFASDKKNKALAWLSNAMAETAIGEILDVERGDAKMIMKLKTARYTVSGPLILGAILAGAKQEVIDRLEDFGDNLGIAFQIQDDILGIFGNEQTTGKSINSDISEGKNTVLFEYACQSANDKDKKFLAKFYGKGTISSQQGEEIRRIFRTTGALDYAKKETEKYRDEALRVLPQVTKDTTWSKIFEHLAESLINRSK